MNVRCIIFLTTLVSFSLHYSSTTIIIRTGRPGLQYLNLMRRGFDNSDPIESFTLRSRRMLCDAVLTAKQFIGKYSPGCSSAVATTKMTVIWEPSDDLSIINYQRRRRCSSARYQFRSVRAGDPKMRMKTLLCMKSSDTEWYITFGWASKLMFLVEPYAATAVTPGFRITGIVEPSSVLITSDFNDEELHYFSNQVIGFQADLEAPSDLGVNDRVRICSSVFEVLCTRRKLLHCQENKYVNYVRVIHKGRTPGRLVRIEIFEETVAIRALPCWLNNEDPSANPLFYILADYIEDGSVFVLIQDEKRISRKRNENSKWFARVGKVGALLYPLKESS